MKGRSTLKLWLVVVVILLSMAGIVFGGKIIYVDAGANGLNDGSSWEDAYNYLRDALSDASSSPKPVEVRVAQGIYKPDQSTPFPQGTGDRYATFHLINSVSLKGGYAGFGESDPNSRDIEAYETILSGDLNGDDGPDFTNNGENSYHVVTSSGTNATAILDGFIITAGNANDSSWPANTGGGMYNYSGSPTVTNCTFADNSAEFGGGMSNVSSSPTVTNCAFSGNSAENGGGMCNTVSSPTVTNCKFNDNSGGGMFNWDNSSPVVTNCTFSGNSADWGGGMYNLDSIGPMVTNCTFSSNTSHYYGGGMYNFYSNPTLTNCIFWGNTDQISNYVGSSITVTYSDVQGGYPGEGNIDADPLFVDANNGDYHLLSNSPCINAGDPDYIAGPNETDIDGDPRILRNRVDIGADEYNGSLYLLVPSCYLTIQSAIDAAVNGDTVIVSPGTYTGDGNRDINFKGKAITVRSTDPNDSNVVASTIIDCQGTKANPHRCFYFHSGEDSNSVLNGFTIKNGYAEYGGAIYCNKSSPIVKGCTFTTNSADYGGGMENEYNSNPILIDCTFNGNSAIISGGGIRNHSSSPSSFDCLFIDNKAQCGGAIHNENNASKPFFIRCTFIGNTASNFGGAVRNHTSSPTVLNSLIIGNRAQCGGGIHNENSSSNPTLINCTLSNNSATMWGGGIINHSGVPILNNCILWANSDNGGLDESAQIHGGTPVVRYCCIQGWTGGLGGIGNIGSNPLFVAPSINDYHLLSDSPCINAGDPDYVAEPNETDIDGELRVMLGRIDMGADEFNPFEIDFIVVNKRRIGRTIFEYDCSASLHNISLFDVENIQLEIVKTPENMRIIDPIVTFGNAVVGVGQSATSIDTCTFEVDRSQAIEPMEIIWWSSCDLVAAGQTIQHSGSSIIFLEEDNISGDLTGEGQVDFADLAVLAEQWLWVGQAGNIPEDIIEDGIVNFLDFAKLAENWRL